MLFRLDNLCYHEEITFLSRRNILASVSLGDWVDKLAGSLNSKELVMANQGTQGGSSEQHRKAGEQSHKNDDKDKKQTGGSGSSGSSGSSGGRGKDDDDKGGGGRRS
jgi:uncharacterized membrane protein YgcG